MIFSTTQLRKIRKKGQERCIFIIISLYFQVTIYKTNDDVIIVHFVFIQQSMSVIRPLFTVYKNTYRVIFIIFCGVTCLTVSLPPKWMLFRRVDTYTNHMDDLEHGLQMANKLI